MITTSKVITEKIDVEITKTIFHWTTKPAANTNFSPNCHCLLRIFIYPNQNKAIVIASELFRKSLKTNIYLMNNCKNF
jgi:hypothetical protein